MVKKSIREVLFFVLVLIVIFFALKFDKWWSIGLDPNMKHLLISLFVVTILIVIFFLARLNENTENFWDVSPAALCRGGPYMWQGDSETAKMCKEMAATEEGSCAISSYNCPTGYIGTPKIPFYYSPLSGDSWQNERCTHETSCNCSKESQECLNSFERQVPFNTNTKD